MAFPFMIDSLVFLPPSISMLALLGLLIAGIVEIRHGMWIGRPGITVNALLLWQIFYKSWTFLPEWFQWYLNIGTVVAIVSLGSYLLGESLPKEFYQITFILYGSISIIAVVWMAIFSGIPILS